MGRGRGQPHSAARNVYRRKTGARAIVSEGSDDPPLVSRTQHIDMRPAQRARAGASYGAARLRAGFDSRRSRCGKLGAAPFPAGSLPRMGGGAYLRGIPPPPRTVLPASLRWRGAAGPGACPASACVDRRRMWTSDCSQRWRWARGSRSAGGSRGRCAARQRTRMTRWGSGSDG